MSTDKKQLLETKLWSIADTLRGKMDADDFRDYILGFIFYKYLNLLPQPLLKLPLRIPHNLYFH